MYMMQSGSNVTTGAIEMRTGPLCSCHKKAYLGEQLATLLF